MRLLPALAAPALALVLASSTNARGGVPPLLFPIVGAVTYRNDFGDPRGARPHEGNDLLGQWRAPVVAVEDGTVEYWTSSASAGCMLYLNGVSGTTYQYVHLNNDLTAKNDNRGKCVKGVSYSVADGASVTAGQQIAYLGDSGDANGTNHVHFEVHPNGGAAANPFPYLKKASRLLVPAPPVGTSFTLKLAGTLVALENDTLTLNVQTLAAWPSHAKQAKVNRVLSLSVADPTLVDPTLVPGAKITIWTQPAPGTLAAITGAPGALTLAKLR